MKTTVLIWIAVILMFGGFRYASITRPRPQNIFQTSKIIYKLEGDHWSQITDIGQIKEGIYVIIR